LNFYDRATSASRQDAADPQRSGLTQALEEDDLSSCTAHARTVTNVLQQSMDAFANGSMDPSDMHLFIVWAERCQLSGNKARLVRLANMQGCHLIWVDTLPWVACEDPFQSPEAVDREDFAQLLRTVMPQSAVISAAELLGMDGGDLWEVCWQTVLGRLSWATVLPCFISRG
jgi:hypothetical protein